ncbi:hypothetical protein BJ912DRAFT_921665 [Pholiota molesta]|nr:hypothetical protein BJ912DRAFT_921665 [Pholiota molesta]
MSNKRSNAFEQQFGIDSSKMVNHVAGLLLSWKQMRELGTFIAGKPLGRDKMEAYPLCLREVEKTNHRLIVFDYPAGSKKCKLMLVLFEHNSQRKFSKKKARDLHHTVTAKEWLKARGVSDTENLKFVDTEDTWTEISVLRSGS